MKLLQTSLYCLLISQLTSCCIIAAGNEMCLRLNVYSIFVRFLRDILFIIFHVFENDNQRQKLIKSLCHNVSPSVDYLIVAMAQLFPVCTLAVVVLLIVAAPAENAKILGIFQTPAFSHQVVYRSLTKALAERGHQLTVMTPNPMDHPNVTEISFKSSYKIFNELINYVRIKQDKLSELETVDLVTNMGFRICSEQLNHPEVKQLIANHSLYEFDLIILEYFNFVPMLGFAELFDCPVIGITSMETSFTVHETFGYEVNAVVQPDQLVFSYPHGRLSFYERVYALLSHHLWKFVAKPIFDYKMMTLLREHFPSVTESKKELENRLALMMINTSPVLGSIRPLVPKVLQLGFLHISPPKPLPEGDVKQFLDQSEHGVIYMSFGSIAKSSDFPSDFRDIFLNVFARIKYDVLWKFEAENLPNKSSNVMTSKWLPQSDVFAHPKVKLVICQGGQQTVEEAIDREVPIIVVPFIQEQEGNGLKLVERGVGSKLDFHTLNEDLLLKAIEEMTKPIFKENIRKLRNLVYDQPMSSIEKAVWWTEYVIRNNGTGHLNYPGTLVPFYQKCWLDICCLFIVISFVGVKLSQFSTTQLKFRSSAEKKQQ